MENLFSVHRLVHATFYSYAGIRYALKTSPAFCQECLLLIVLLPCIYILNLTTIEKLFLLFSLILILIAELINTAMEAIVDRISLDKHPLSKSAKDLSSAAVGIALLNALISWGIILLNYFMR